MSPEIVPNEGWEARWIGAGMSVVGHPDRGYQLVRSIGERTIQLAGKTLDRAYYNATMGMLGERDWDVLFKRSQPPTRAPLPGHIYFIAGDTGAVKIGFAVRPDLRLSTLQCGSPIRLRILATVAGMPKDERAYHKQFAHRRLHGEWFERCPEIEAEIERLSK